jgi:hypothetical protein
LLLFGAIVENKAIYDDYGELVLKFGGVTPKGCKSIILRPFISISVRKMGGKWFVKEP